MREPVAGNRLFAAAAALSCLALTVLCVGCYVLSRFAELKAAEGRLELPDPSKWLFAWDWLLWVIPVPFVVAAVVIRRTRRDGIAESLVFLASVLAVGSVVIVVTTIGVWLSAHGLSMFTPLR